MRDDEHTVHQLQVRNEQLLDALASAKKELEECLVYFGQQGGNMTAGPHLTNPLRYRWESARAAIKYIDAAIEGTAPVPAGKFDPAHEPPWHKQSHD